MKNEMWGRTREWIGDIRPPSFDRVAGYSSIIGLVLTVISLFNVRIEESFENGILFFIGKWIEKTWVYLVLVWSVLLIVFLIMMILKYRNSVIIKMNAASLGLSYIMDRTTEVIDKMEHIEEEMESEQNNGCSGCEMGKAIYRKLLNTVFVEYVVVVLNKICYIFSGYVSYKVSACLKLVVDPEDNTSGTEPHVFTLARNRESAEIRNRDRILKPVPISANTDFVNIINGSKNGNIRGNAAYFYVGNLKKYAEEIDRASNGEYKYLNSNPDWDQYYIGTIVVPVGLFLPSKNGKQYKVWGFLCVDSLSPKAFTKSQKTINIKLLQGFASIISIAVSIYQKKINTYK